MQEGKYLSDFDCFKVILKRIRFRTDIRSSCPLNDCIQRAYRWGEVDHDTNHVHLMHSVLWSPGLNGNIQTIIICCAKKG